MKFNQAFIAEDLYQQLNHHFKNKKEPIEITIEGAGVHWHCLVVFQNKKCKIHCFENYNEGNPKAEYLIFFNDWKETKLTGRTNKLEEVLNSSAAWIFNKGIDFLYRLYDFIDWEKRRVNFIENKFLLHEPQLRHVSTKKNYWNDICEFMMIYKNRSCKLSGFGKNEPVSFHFLWDQCQLFEVEQDDLTLMAKVIKKWLVDEIAPSVLGNQFDWIKISDLARYYERGEGIKGEFVKSWNDIEIFYRRFNDHFRTKELVLNLIQELRKNGFDEILRAGQSLYMFLVSRSRRHGLVTGQNFIKFVFNTDKNEMSVKNSLEEELLNGEIKYSTQLEAILKDLAKEEIT